MENQFNTQNKKELLIQETPSFKEAFQNYKKASKKESRWIGIAGLVLFVILGGLTYCPWYLWIFVIILAIITLSGLYRGLQTTFAILVLLFCTPIFSYEDELGGSSGYSIGQSQNYNSSTSLSNISGKYSYFQPYYGNRKGSLSIILKISASGNVDFIESVAGLGWEEIKANGSGKASISGNVLNVELTSGKGRGHIYKFKIIGNSLMLGDIKLEKERF